MINSIYIIGRLTKEPKIVDNNGFKIANFDLAFDNLSKDESGNKTTSFITCIAFSKLAEVVGDNLHKGAKVLVNGTLQQRNWLDKTGAKRSTYEVLVNSLEFLDAKAKTEDAPKFDPYTGKPLK